MSDILTLDHDKKTYSVKQGLFGKHKPLSAVNDVTLSIRKGEVLGLVGESGCGKSTLTRAILGLEPVQEGQITLDGDPAAVRIRLDDELFDLDRPVRVVRGGEELFTGTVPRTIATLDRTLSERGDPRGMFSSELTIDAAQR